MTSRNTNQPVTPGASSALDQMKYEIASELGLTNYQQMDKGSLPSRVNGYVGGNMTKKLVAYAEQALASGNTAQILQSAPTEQIGQRS
ncbi:alpha/beta-type small acid-soluble spore protein [Desulforamulus putei]|uniref:Small, acid-soluble spore protein, alpha/beta type n=1 Tax=Desulforamulus putei DSM 12395 TaxID=1121429 RepID=A0A1M4XGD7_9FIRM|nr:alpha/beta-type small acid-soluble spore protein [Desulforamulus putei]SHE92393.1 Small, acid-soluble spore protein, alpha/beta type [Desulforamulus putei DSM 12395]